ncbi:hypothetical protein I4U23_024832 [Adineta vaga]|nr:hypothetical protein I4U23_024832 [Adineta vaga]
MKPSDKLLGFAEAWILLITGLSCIAIVAVVTILMYLKYIVFHKSRHERSTEIVY